MSSVTVPHPRSDRHRRVFPVVAWESIATAALAIVKEVRGDRRALPLLKNGRRLLKALDSRGITVEPIRVITVPAGAKLALTQRELQVLRGMSDGLENAEIGRHLFVSEDTIKTHARRMFRKLGARNRAHAVAEGFRLGILRTDIPH